MNQFIIPYLEAFVLVIALSIDAFFACFAYGTDQIKIPWSSVLMINTICSGILGISLFIGTVIKTFIPVQSTIFICFALMFTLGIFKLFDSYIKIYLRKRKNGHRKITFSALHLRFILDVYADPKDADRDCSRTLSPSEAVFLALALSLDSLGVGIGAGIGNYNIWLILGFSFILGVVAVVSGCILGYSISKKTTIDLSWLSGIILIILAVLKIVE